MKLSRESGVESRKPEIGASEALNSITRRSDLVPRPIHAFTLLEVMVAMGIFFMAVFSILALVSNGLRNASALQRDYPTASQLAAMLAETNKLEEMSVEGRFEDIAPGFYPGYKYREDFLQEGTNGLWQVDFYIARVERSFVEKPDLSILLWVPGQSTRPLPRR